MEGMPVWAPGMGGLIVGAAIGFATRRARLCSFGAVEDALMGGDTRRLKAFGLALGVAILGTQALVLAGALGPGETSYVSAALPWFGVAIGGLMFGFGMALVGTCSFGSLVRLGGGDLRSLIVIGIFGAAAFAALRGVLAGPRLAFFESIVVDVPPQADLPALTGWTGGDFRPLLTFGLGLGLVAFAVTDARLRRATRLMTAGAIIGLGVVGGWVATLFLADGFATAARPQSLTFVAPVGRFLNAALTGQGALFDFGAGSLFGVTLGAFYAAWRADEFRWEAFDDTLEMRRHLFGATLMGIGGVLAGGCTLGQGLTAGSLLALSWPLAVGGMVIGARLGIAVLVEGSVRELLSRGLARFGLAER